MIGLIDCNNFFVSCERVFNPAIRQKPVVVLSNNDGCAIALSNEAKELGVKRGDPLFQIKGLCNAYDIHIFSGNHRLYSDMSSRVMSTLEQLVSDIEIYSVDEAFLYFDNGINDDNHSLDDFGHEIVRKVRRDTGIPTSLGIAPTKTLAKIAARFAKKYPGYRGCCIIDNDEKRRKALSLTPIGDVWGIGRRWRRRLTDYGVTTALQFADWSINDIENVFNIVGEKTWMELNGHPAVDFEPEDLPQKQMMCSRSFGHSLTEFDEIASAIASFANSVGRRLRERSLCATSLSVFIRTDHFRSDIKSYNGAATRSLLEPTSDTMILTAEAIEALRVAFRQGYAYKKAGICINEVIDSRYIQQSLFTQDIDRSCRNQLMSIVDRINSRTPTRDVVHLPLYVPYNKFSMQTLMSPLFSTRFSDIIKIGKTS